MALTVSTFRARFPAFADETAYPDTLIDEVIQEASRRMSLAFFGSHYDDAQKFLVAHVLEYTTKTRGAGAVSSMSVGAVSVGYFAGGLSDNTDLHMTSYGRVYLRYVQMHGGLRVI